MNPYIKKVIFISLIILACFFIFFFWKDYFTFSTLNSYKNILKDYYLASPLKFIMLYFFSYILATGLSLPGTALLTLSSGFLFGTVKGTIIVVLASNIGALIAFFISRYLIKDLIFKFFFKKKKLLNTILKNTTADGAYYLFTLRLIPSIPFFIVNIFMGLTGIKAHVFFLVSVVGMFPATLLYVNAGTHISQLESTKDIISFPILISFALLGVFPILIKKILQKKDL